MRRFGLERIYMTPPPSPSHRWHAMLVAVIGLAASVSASAIAAETRFIVKFKDGTAKASEAPNARLARIADDMQVGLRFERTMALGMSVVSADSPANADALAAQLATHPDVAWVQPDRRKQPQRVPNDEFINGQTYLSPARAGIDAFGAWDITTGSASTVVAVVDTGYRPHADLAGRILPGYDFIHDPAYANDGDGRDPDASDPGDWVNTTDQAQAPFADCDLRPSSWHGTAVAGIIAANTNNAAWVAGIDWQAKILPVRVLGKCGGWDADIIDGIAWAAGLHVPGIPDNPRPAAVINLSLGGAGSCGFGYQAVISAALATGRTKAIVVAAGNDSDDVAAHEPANCPGVLTVASTTTAGNLARYSNRGADVTLSAPGGQYAPNGLSDGILVLSNAGTTTPSTDSFRNGGGTSFAAPMVSGTIALMLAVNPGLSAADVRSIVLSTVRPFPGGSTCDTTICGAGIVNAHAAVAAAQALAPPSATVQIVEYYNASLDHYFITWVPGEIAALDAGTIRGWQRTGATFNVYPGPQPGSSPVCRYYLPPAYGDSHFFGRGTYECDQTGLHNPGFVLESSEFMDVLLPVNGVCPAGTLPVYRVFSNRPDANHRYMTDPALRDAMVARGWLAEGDGPDLVVMCAPQ